MIQFIIIGKVFLFIVPAILFYLFRKMANKQQFKKKSHLSDFDKENIADGEIVTD